MTIPQVGLFILHRGQNADDTTEMQYEAALEVLLLQSMAAGMDIDALYEGNARDKQGKTLLMHSSALELTRSADKLLARRVDIASKDVNEKDPIEHAENDRVKASFAKHLVQVDITLQNKNGLLLVFLASELCLPAVLLTDKDEKHTD